MKGYIGEFAKRIIGAVRRKARLASCLAGVAAAYIILCAVFVQYNARAEPVNDSSLK